METWPVTLQQLLNVDSFNYQFGNTTVRSDMDVGPAKVRSRYTDGVDQITCSIDMDLDQYDTLKDFFKTALGNGTRTFEFLHPLTQDPIEARFMAPPTMTPIGGRYFKVAMQWEVMP